MKIIRSIYVPVLWEFMEQHLPSTLITRAERDHYGSTIAVTIRQNIFGGMFQQHVARIDDGDIIEIFQPQFFCDLQEVIEKYEALTGRDVTVKLWEKLEK